MNPTPPGEAQPAHAEAESTAIEGMPITAPPCQIVAIGASAGGLEALEPFLRHMPANTGLAFVLVQHMETAAHSALPSVIQRMTHMPVQVVEDGTVVLANHLYLIKPGFQMSISQGVLHLHLSDPAESMRRPIDHFFRSLAEDLGPQAMAVVLSGLGSDGSMGVRSIKNKGGRVFAQSASSAKFDSMPRCVIETGLADGVASPEALPEKLLTLMAPATVSVPGWPEASQADLGDALSGLEKVIRLLRKHTGQDFSHYKKSTLYRRIERRMALHQLPRIEQYARYLRETPTESELLFKELLIGVTHFFRDPSVWEELKNNAIPLLLATRPVNGVIRAWTAGCSTGEEAYTLAIVLREALDKIEPRGPTAIQIFATDLDPEAIDTARQGIYPSDIASDITPARLERFFVPEGNGYRVSKDIRDLVIFATQNMVMDPPFTKLDILTCRNLLIYLDAELQKKLMPLFHYSLNPGGLLVLGSSETVGLATELFATTAAANRIYRRQNSLPRAELAEFPTTLGRTRADGNAIALGTSQQSANHLKTHTDTLLLQHYAPPAVLCTEKGDIVYISGRTGQFLEPAAGKASLSLFAMAREGLSSALHEVFAKAIRQNRPATLLGVRVGGKDSLVLVDVTVHPLTEPTALQGMVLTLFRAQSAINTDLELPPTDATTVTDARVADLVRELKQSREELQSTREEMQTSQEELKSTNEELQSTNEELQSTNEELTTSKEELQSMNEELTTVNHELQSKLDELSQASDDMKNLLNSTDIATLFLDDELHVRRFTNRTTSIIKLIPGDAGRPITDIVTDLNYPTMCDDAREVLRTLMFRERQVATHDGRWFRVRIMPYRTQDKRIEGVVITFVDVGIAKAKEVALRKAMDLIEQTLIRTTDTSAPPAAPEPSRVLKELLELLKQPLIAGEPTDQPEPDCPPIKP